VFPSNARSPLRASHKTSALIKDTRASLLNAKSEVGITYRTCLPRTMTVRSRNAVMARPAVGRSNVHTHGSIAPGDC